MITCTQWHRKMSNSFTKTSETGIDGIKCVFLRLKNPLADRVEIISEMPLDIQGDPVTLKWQKLNEKNLPTCILVHIQKIDKCVPMVTSMTTFNEFWEKFPFKYTWNLWNLTFILGFLTIDLKLKKDGCGLVMSPGLHENKLCTLMTAKQLTFKLMADMFCKILEILWWITYMYILHTVIYIFP